METEVIFGQVVAKANHYKAVPDGRGGRRIIKDEAVRQYERRFSEQCRVYRGRGIREPFRLTIRVYTSSARFDLDNSLKTVLDCLQYVQAITDDSLCYSIIAEKHLSDRPRVEYAIEPLYKQGTLFPG